MNKPTLEQWLERLESIHPREIDLGLERVGRVAESLGLLPLQQPVVTIAGTNGKGSTVAALEAVLQEAGQCVGTYTSPHFLRFNERIRVGGQEVSDDEIITAFAAIEDARDNIRLTYFEFATLAALLVFRERRPDIVVLEVGLGGRLDAVNIVDPTVAVITSIDLDHQDWLGHSRDDIAREKAGILRQAVPAVIADPQPPAALQACIETIGASPHLYLGRDFHVAANGEEWHGSIQQLAGGNRSVGPFRRGPLLPQNVLAAFQVAELLGIQCSEQQMARALDHVSLHGRLETRQIGGFSYVLDVAHNPAAVHVLLEKLSSTDCIGRKIAVFAIMSDKDVKGIIDKSALHFDGWFLAELPGVERAAQAGDVAAMLNAAGQNRVSISKNPRQAFRRAQSVASPGDTLVIFGSFYTVAALLPVLEKEQQKHEVV